MELALGEGRSLNVWFSGVSRWVARLFFLDLVSLEWRGDPPMSGLQVFPGRWLG